jgi:4-aminobutyrate aminotransferase-like enzyme
MTHTDSSGMVNAFTGADAALDPDTARLVARRNALLGPAYRLFYHDPLHIVRGEGVWLTDATGKRYLDAYNNVVSVGHSHPRVTTAIARQADLLNTHTRYLHETILDYAERLLARFPDALDRVMFTCSGSEANDLALRIAKAATGAEGVIVTEHAYHGVTEAIAALSPSIRSTEPRAVHVETVPAPGRFLGLPDPGAAFADAIEAAIARLARRGIGTAALFADTVFSSDGLYLEPAGFLRPAIARLHAAGALFVADEVQAGFGRTGDAMWGFARHGVIPDLVTLGKPMANGHPVGGVVMRAALVEAFGAKTRYFNTFAGNPVSMAAALATLEVIEETMAGFCPTAQALAQGFADLARTSARVGAVRGSGFFWAIDVVDDQGPDAAGAAAVVNHLRHHGVLISAVGPQANVLKIRPPLVTTPEQAGMIVEALALALRHG